MDPNDVGDHAVDVARRLKSVRTALGVTQADFSEAAGIGRTAYNQYETGTRLLTLAAAMRICERYGVTLDWLYRGDPSGLPHRLFESIRAASPKPA